MKVLALDVATRTGIAVGSAGGVPEAWAEDLGRGGTEDARFSKALSMTSRLLADHAPDVVAIEAPIAGRTKNDFLIGVTACIRGTCFNRGYEPKIYYRASVLKHFTGRAWTARDFASATKGKAKQMIKQQVIDRCRLLGWGDLDEDSADAAALWDYASAMEGAQVSPAGELFR